MTRQQAIEAVKIHWRENLELAKEGKQFEYYAGSCALCELYRTSLKCHSYCPLMKIGHKCDEPNSLWFNVFHAVHDTGYGSRKTIKACERFLKVIEKL